MVLAGGEVGAIPQPPCHAQEIFAPVVAGMAQLQDMNGRNKRTAVALALAAQFAICPHDNGFTIAAFLAKAL